MTLQIIILFNSWRYCRLFCINIICKHRPLYSFFYNLIIFPPFYTDIWLKVEFSKKIINGFWILSSVFSASKQNLKHLLKTWPHKAPTQTHLGNSVCSFSLSPSHTIHHDHSATWLLCKPTTWLVSDSDLELSHTHLPIFKLLFLH